VFQYVLGMLVNLYVNIPFGNGSTYEMGVGGMMSIMFSSGMPLVMEHMMNGMLLFFLTLFTVIGAILSGQRWLTFASVGMFGSVTAAGVGGIGFLMSGGAQGYSLLNRQRKRQ
jgi:hypothetical protein